METLELLHAEMEEQSVSKWIRLSDESMVTAVKLYQDAYRTGSLTDTWTPERGRMDRYANALIDSALGLVLAKLNPALRRRFGNDGSDVIDEARGEAVAFILERAQAFDPARNSSFTAYLSSQTDTFVAGLVSRLSARGGMRPATERMMRVVCQILREDVPVGVTPSRKFIMERLIVRQRDYARARVEVTDDCDEEALIDAYLVKHTMRSAREDLDVVLNVLRSEVRLDQPLEGGGSLDDLVHHEPDAGTVAQEPEPDSVLEKIYALALGDHAPKDRALLAAQYGLLGAVEGLGTLEPDNEDKSWTLKRISSHTNMTRVEVREWLKHRVQSRVSAPHAHYAHLAPLGDLVFEEEPATKLSEMTIIPRSMFL